MARPNRLPRALTIVAALGMLAPLAACADDEYGPGPGYGGQYAPPPPPPPPGYSDDRNAPPPGYYDQRSAPPPAGYRGDAPPPPGAYDDRNAPPPGYDDRNAPPPGYDDQRGGPPPAGYRGDAAPPPPGGGYGDDRPYYADHDYQPREGEERALTRNDRVYRGSDGRYYCERGDGTTGLIVGAALGGILGNVIDGGHNRVFGTLLGGAGGAALGKSVDEGQVRCR